MAVAIGDIVRINALVSFEEQSYENVHHFEVLANATVDDTAFMVALQVIIAPIYANVQNQQTDNLRYERIEGQNLTQDVLLPAANWLGNPTGDSILDPLPPQVAANVFWTTLRPKTRCTTYVPGFSVGANNLNGKWDSGAITDLQAFGDQFIGTLAFGGVSIKKGAYNVLLDRFTDIVTAKVPIESRTQRRRRVGVGE